MYGCLSLTAQRDHLNLTELASYCAELDDKLLHLYTPEMQQLLQRCLSLDASSSIYFLCRSSADEHYIFAFYCKNEEREVSGKMISWLVYFILDNLPADREPESQREYQKLISNVCSLLQCFLKDIID